MIKMIPCLIILLLLVGCGDRPRPTTAQAAKDPKIAAVEQRVAKNTPEAKQMIEKVQAMKPEVNGQVSTKTLGEMVDEYSKNKGTYNIIPLGWEASQKKPIAGEKAGRWKVIFNYQTWDKQLIAAEWEYNVDSNKLYPFETTTQNAAAFWSNEGAPAQGNKGKK